MSDEPNRRRGRPALVEGEVSTRVNVRVSPRDYDAAYLLARKARVSVPEMFRRGLLRVIRDERGG